MTAMRSPAPPATTGGEGVGALLDRVWDRIVGLAPLAFGLGLVTLTVLRSGFGTHEREMGNWVYLTRQLPDPVADWRSNTVPGPVLARLVGVDTVPGWIGLHLLLTALVAVVVALVVRRRFATTASRRVAATWLAMASVAPSLLQKIGSYDVYTAVGCLLVVWGRRPWVAAVGGALLGATSAEQGALGLVAAAVVSTTLARPDDPSWRGMGADARRDPVVRRVVAALVALVAVRVGVLAWFALSGVAAPSRGEMMRVWLADSLEKSAGASAGGLYAWFGGAWGLLVLAWAVGRWAPRRVALVAGALVLVPAAASVTTLDGTRVFAMVSLPALLVLVGWVVERAEQGEEGSARLVHRATAAVLVLAPIVPALITDPNGGASFTVPWFA
jgi:hypothetical protein